MKATIGRIVQYDINEGTRERSWRWPSREE